MHRALGFLVLVVSVCLTSVADASAVLSVGAIGLQFNKANQQVPVFITNDSPAATAGMNLWVLVGDGGPPNNLTGPGSQVGPSVTIDIISAPNLFSVNNTGQGNLDPADDFGPQGAGASTTTGSGTINVPVGSVQIGTLIFDTTGLASWPLLDLNMGGSNNLTSAFLTDISGTSINGLELLVIDGSILPFPFPEPSSILIGSFGVVALTAVAWRRRR